MYYYVHEAEISRDNKKGIIAGKELASFESKKVYTPGTMIKVKNRNRRIRCIDYPENQDYGKILVE
jgi:hypothetical protein